MREPMDIIDQLKKHPKAYFSTENGVLLCGDCLEIMKDIPNKSVDLVLTDPPYSSGSRQATNRKAGGIPKRGEKWSRGGIIWDSAYSHFGLSQLMNYFYRHSQRILKPHSHIYTFIDWRQYPLLTLTIEQSSLFINNLLIWDKGVYALGGNYRSQHELIVFASNGPGRELNAHDLGNVIKCKRVAGGEHPTEKPVDLLKTIISYSTNEADLVVDPFSGSGSTLIASEKLNRHWIGIEISEEYCSIASKRIKAEADQIKMF